MNKTFILFWSHNSSGAFSSQVSLAQLFDCFWYWHTAGLGSGRDHVVCFMTPKWKNKFHPTLSFPLQRFCPMSKNKRPDSYPLVQLVTNSPKQGSYSEASLLMSIEYVLVGGNAGRGDRQIWERCAIVNTASMKVTICWEAILTHKILSKHEWNAANPTRAPDAIKSDPLEIFIWVNVTF